MITKETAKNIFGAAANQMPALDRVVTLFLSSVDNRTVRALSAEDKALKAVEWYMDAAVNDEVVDYCNRNLRYYPTAEFLKTSLDEDTIFQMSVGFSSPFPVRRLARRSVFVPNVAERRLVYLGTSPHDSKGDIYIGLHGKTTAYKYDFGGYHTYLSEDGKLIITKETILQDANDPENRLVIRSVIPEERKKISLSALDTVVAEEFRGLYAK